MFILSLHNFLRFVHPTISDDRFIACKIALYFVDVEVEEIIFFLQYASCGPYSNWSFFTELTLHVKFQAGHLY